MDHSQVTVNLNIEPVSAVLDVCKKLVSAFHGVTEITDEERKEVRLAVSTTCEMIDTVLSTVKQRLGTIAVKLRAEIAKGSAADFGAVSSDIAGLRYTPEWEQQYRNFQLCEALRVASSELKSTFYGRFKARFALKDVGHLESVIDEFLDAKAGAGPLISALLDRLANLDTNVSEDPRTVLSEFEEARKRIQAFKDEFIAMEKQMTA
jgi:hypothetical protein